MPAEAGPHRAAVAVLALVTAGAGLALLLNRDSAPAPAVRSTPAYGAPVSSPVTVGGRITGVDERLAVQVRSRQGGLLGRSAPSGGRGDLLDGNRADGRFDGRARRRDPANSRPSAASYTGAHRP